MVVVNSRVDISLPRMGSLMRFVTRLAKHEIMVKNLHHAGDDDDSKSAVA